MTKKRIGIFTSGGDCAGLNVAMMAITKRAHQYGWEVIGIRNGVDGIEFGDYYTIGEDFPWGEKIREGGTFLGAYARGNNTWTFVSEEDSIKRDLQKGIGEKIKKMKLDAIIGTCGNGSLLFYNRYAIAANCACILLPKTVDNDTPGTDISIGFSSAAETCTGMLDNLFWTSRSHRRAFTVEVMGRDAGHLAVRAGITSGADVILIPEIPYTLENIYKKLMDVKKREKREFFNIVVAEGAGAEHGQNLENEKCMNSAEYVSKYLESRGINSRAVSLGHVQRGSLPSQKDRLLASQLGVYAVDVFKENPKARALVGIRNGKLACTNIEDIKDYEFVVDPKSEEVQTALKLGIYMGEIA
ncbi:MAG: ATP-dependent 6-phosphofructokinase [Alphaproteobacteria bacterium]|nr:ATP-dependent 6-phosphofructokinase [Alphaproteobacteria bacterium]